MPKHLMARADLELDLETHFNKRKEKAEIEWLQVILPRKLP